MIQFHALKTRLTRFSHQPTFFSVLVVPAICLPPPAMAARPMSTDDAAVIEQGACQLETWFERMRNDSGNATIGWFNPTCNPLGSTEFAFASGREHSNSASATLTSWQIKRLLRPYDDEQAGFAISLGDSRDRRVHRHFFGDTRLTGIVTFPFSERMLLGHINLGVERRRGDEVRHTRGFWSGALDLEFADSSRVSFESFGTSGERASWQIGLVHELIPERMQIDMSVGSPYGRWSSERTLTFGMVFAFPPFLN